MGLVIHSYWKRWRGNYSSLKAAPFRNALDVMDHVRSLGVGALQIGVEDWTLDHARQVRASCESYNMALEGSIRLPASEGDVGRFERELRTAREAGATIFRTAMGGRRYEVFTKRADFEQWKASALRAMTLAEPIARRLGVRIGVENHKDWETAELVEALRTLSSPHIGACIDTGNSIALLEDPLAVVTALAPYVVTVHLKDMAVRAHEAGFQLAEVPLGQGVLDLPAMIAAIRTANPQAGIHLEMITRDPLDIPCLNESYWATFPGKPGADLARTLTWVRTRQSEKLPRTTGLPQEVALEQEEANIRNSLTHGGQHLGFDHLQLRKADAGEEK